MTVVPQMMVNQQFILELIVFIICSTACQQDVFALLVPSCLLVWNKSLSSCNKVDEANKLFQQD